MSEGVRPRKLSRHLPEPLRPLARRLGLERNRLRSLAHEAAFRLHLRRGAVRHVSGPPDIRAGPGQVFVVCMVRNGMTWLPTWLDHYRSLGADHIVLLDNGSTDATREVASEGDDTTVFRCDLPFGRYLLPFARWLKRRFAGEGWTLMADIDELFGYPYDDRLPLPGLMAYLDRRGFTAMVVQHLEMIADAPLRSLEVPENGDLRSAYPLYDITDVVRARDKYWRWMNEGVTDAHRTHIDGLRATFFDWRGAMLTKIALSKPSAGVTLYPYDNHFCTGARVADVTGIFRHYKYIHGFFEQVRMEARRGQHYNSGRMYRWYDRKLAENPDVNLARESSERWRGTTELLENGYVLASDDYRAWVREHRPGGAPP